MGQQVELQREAVLRWNLHLAAGLAVLSLVLVSAGLGLDEWAEAYVHASPDFDPWLANATAFLLPAIIISGCQLALILYTVHQIGSRQHSRMALFALLISAAVLGALCGLFYATPVFSFPADLSDSRTSISLVISSTFFALASVIPLGMAAHLISKPNTFPGREVAYDRFLTPPSSPPQPSKKATSSWGSSPADKSRDMKMSTSGPTTPDIPTSRDPAMGSSSDSEEVVLNMEELFSSTSPEINRRTSDELLRMASMASPHPMPDIPGDSDDSDDGLSHASSVPVGLSLEKSTGKSKLPSLSKEQPAEAADGNSVESTPPSSEQSFSRGTATAGPLVATKSYPGYPEQQPSCLPPLMRRKQKKDTPRAPSSSAPQSVYESRNTQKFSVSAEPMGRKSNGRVARFKASLDRFANLVTDQPGSSSSPGRVPSYYLQQKRLPGSK